ncbi:hypothetical protein PENSPDRAFT_684031 [Peniophora sp. CONT]|nr:hypothetical protein PENSPDRAFT_684031 [Peniophora sp. CONT]
MSAEAPIRDDLFYFHSVVFQAENRLFKVPRYGLPGDAAVFDTMFGQATGGAGSSDDNPIHLDADVRATDFRSLLKAAFPPPGATVAVLNLDEWMGVLTLAKKWKLESMKDKAIAGSDAEIQKKTDIDKVLLAKKYSVAKWLKEGYCSLASREDALTPQESQELGWETCARLMFVRESGRKAVVLGLSTKTASTTDVRCCNACGGYHHRPYCADNVQGSQDGGYRRRCSTCQSSYHIPGCSAGDSTPPNAQRGEDISAQWATFDFTAAVEKEFVTSIKM